MPPKQSARELRKRTKEPSKKKQTKSKLDFDSDDDDDNEQESVFSEKKAKRMYNKTAMTLDKIIIYSLVLCSMCLALEIIFPESALSKIVFSPPLRDSSCDGMVKRDSMDYISLSCGFLNPHSVTALPYSEGVLVAQSRESTFFRSIVNSLGTSVPVSNPENPADKLKFMTLSGFSYGLEVSEWRDLKSGEVIGDVDCLSAPLGDEDFIPGKMASVSLEQTTGKAKVDLVAIVNLSEKRRAIELFHVAGGGVNVGSSVSLNWKGCIHIPESVLVKDVTVSSAGMIAIASAPRTTGQIYSLYGLIPFVLSKTTGAEHGDVLVWKASRRQFDSVKNGKVGYPSAVAWGVNADLYFADILNGGRICKIDVSGSDSKAVGCSFISEQNLVPSSMVYSNKFSKLFVTSLISERFNYLNMMRCMLGREPCDSKWALHVVKDETTTSESAKLNAVKLTDSLHHGLGSVSSVAIAGDWLVYGANYGEKLGFTYIHKGLKKQLY